MWLLLDSLLFCGMSCFCQALATQAMFIITDTWREEMFAFLKFESVHLTLLHNHIWHQIMWPRIRLNTQSDLVSYVTVWQTQYLFTLFVWESYTSVTHRSPYSCGIHISDRQVLLIDNIQYSISQTVIQKPLYSNLSDRQLAIDYHTTNQSERQLTLGHHVIY